MKTKAIKAGICAPSSHFKSHMFKPSLDFLKKNKIEAVFTRSLYKRSLFTAGTAMERTKDIINILKSDVDIILFARGGYGSAQILPLLERINIKKYINKKSLMGFSDITALLSYLYFKYNKISFYGPNMVSPYFRNRSILDNVINNRLFKKKFKVLHRTRTNNITAPMFGGCLSVLTSLVGTPYIKKLDGHILFIEDTQEAPYKIDRMLNQLYQSGIIAKIRAIVVGTMENCDTPPINWKEPVITFAKTMNIPVVYDIKAGHDGFEYALPIGAITELNIKTKEIIIKP